MRGFVYALGTGGTVIQHQNQYYIVRPTGEPTHNIIDLLDRALADPQNYEDDEPPPDDETIKKLRILLRAAISLGANLGSPQIGTFWGEVDVTWENGPRLIRIISYPGNKPVQIYQLIDNGSPLPKGELAIATAEALVRALISVE